MTNEEALEIIGKVTLTNYTQSEVFEINRAFKQIKNNLELISNLTYRPCSACKFHSKKGCSKWSCPFDEVLNKRGENK